MKFKDSNAEYTISGSCPLFACRCCHTKFGWEHQEWCEAFSLTQPTCNDCMYHSERRGICIHPAKKRSGREDLPYEEDKCAVRAGQNA